MKILALDTSTRFLCLGLYDNNKIYEYTLETARQLSCLLGLTVKRVIDVLGWQAKDIDYLACGLGPGSFTGMRTGVSFIKGMSFVTKSPVIGISTLDILAGNAGNTDKQIIPVVDAKRGLVYCSVYKNKNNRLIRIRPYMLLAKEEVFRNFKKDAIILEDTFPKPHNIIKIALERIKDKKFDNPFDIKPIYLYPKECQIREIKQLGQ